MPTDAPLQVCHRFVPTSPTSPSTGAFQLGELDMTPLVPPDTLAPFAEEIQLRERRRRQRLEAEHRRDVREAAAAAAAVAKTQGPSAAELRVSLCHT